MAYDKCPTRKQCQKLKTCINGCKEGYRPVKEKEETKPKQ